MRGMDASTARTLNIREWVAQAGGPAEFSRRYGWSAAQASQWISETQPKGIGNKLARAIERALNKAPGSMDRRDVDQVQSQFLGINPVKLQASIKFLSDLFEAKGREFDPSNHALLLAQVYDELVTATTPNLIEMGIRYGGRLDGDGDERQRAVGGVGKDDHGGAGKGSKAAKTAAGGKKRSSAA